MFSPKKGLLSKIRERIHAFFENKKQSQLTKLDIKEIDKEFEELSQNKISQDEIKEVFAPESDEAVLGGDLEGGKILFATNMGKDIKDIEPHEVKHIPRVSLEDAVNMPLSAPIETQGQATNNSNEPEEESQKEEPPGELISDQELKEEFSFSSSTFQNKKRL